MGGGWFTTQDYVVAGIGVLVAFECAAAWCPPRRARPRVSGLHLPRKYLPGAFGHVGFSLTRVMDHMFWGSQGLLGVGVGVSATYVFLFVLFGAFLRISGFSEFINDLALTLVGRTAGGPAKVLGHRKRPHGHDQRQRPRQRGHHRRHHHSADEEDRLQGRIRRSRGGPWPAPAASLRPPSWARWASSWRNFSA